MRKRPSVVVVIKAIGTIPTLSIVSAGLLTTRNVLIAHLVCSEYIGMQLKLWWRMISEINQIWCRKPHLYFMCLLLQEVLFSNWFKISLTSVDSSTFKCASLSLSFLQRILCCKTESKKLLQQSFTKPLSSRYSRVHIHLLVTWPDTQIPAPSDLCWNETAYKYMACLQVSTYLETS